ncbi:hypothetical protein CBS101457_003446 [Exobasidium rhododendri]|nr:hypothetical protein CBS101457_003446 [Exobasidium rhododendri]
MNGRRKMLVIVMLAVTTVLTNAFPMKREPRGKDVWPSDEANPDNVLNWIFMETPGSSSKEYFHTTSEMDGSDCHQISIQAPTSQYNAHDSTFDRMKGLQLQEGTSASTLETNANTDALAFSPSGPSSSKWQEVGKEFDTSDANERFEQWMNLIDPDRSKGDSLAKELLYAVRLEKRRQTSLKKRRTSQSSTTEEVALPRMLGVKRMVTIQQFNVMSNDDKQRWLNALMVLHKKLQKSAEATEACGKHGMEGKAWPPDTRRMEVEPTSLVDFGTLSEQQRKAWFRHTTRFNSDEILGEMGSGERKRYMSSHMKLRKMGFPFPRPAMNHQSIWTREAIGDQSDRNDRRKALRIKRKKEALERQSSPEGSKEMKK